MSFFILILVYIQETVVRTLIAGSRFLQHRLNMSSFSIEKKEVIPSNPSTAFSAEEWNSLEETQIQSKAIVKDEKNKGQKGYITGFRLYTVLLGITVVGFLVMLDQTIMITAIPKISTQFNSLKDIGA
jgi:hypothetical protein